MNKIDLGFVSVLMILDFDFQSETQVIHHLFV